MSFEKLFDRDRLTIRPLDERKSKTAYDPMPEPDRLYYRQQEFVDNLAKEIKEKKKVVIGFGAHFIKNKCHHVLMELLKEEYITHVVTNGASTIHDFEFSYHGKTEEDVRENLADGTFGLWETGEYINKAINAYSYMGYGSALGRYMEEEANKDHQWYSLCDSLTWRCYNEKIPLSVCTHIGHDIIYEHPECNGANIGEASYIDFLKLANTMEGIKDTVFLCVGSAITMPMVVEKSYAMAKNVAPDTGSNCSCWVVDLVDSVGTWGSDSGTSEPSKSDPSYYLRSLKTFNRMFPGSCSYMNMDNWQLIWHLREALGG